jgi:PAS domain S-box-containing protein
MSGTPPDDSRLRSDELSRSLFDEASDGLFVASPDGVYVAVNRSGHRLLGYDDGELIGKHITEVLPTHDAARLKLGMQAVLGGQVRTQVWSFLGKDGAQRQLEVRSQRLSNGKVLAIVRDLVERAEHERKVHASEAQLRSILHTIPDIIMSVDRAGQILFINRTWAPLEPEQVVGTSCYDYVPADSRERVRRAIEHVFETRGIDEYEVEGPPGPDGVRVATSVRAGPLIERDEVVAATLCATNVTERKQAEKARARLEEQVMQAQRMESVGQLAGGVAHDFNNLLTAVVALVELADQEAPSEKVREYLRGVRDAAARGSALTQQLLAFARKRVVQPENVELAATLARMEPVLRSVVGEHVRVELNVAENAPPVRIDVGSLDRVIMNLVVNARDAMPGGGRLSIGVNERVIGPLDQERLPDLPIGRYAVLSVTDTGTGMTREVRQRLFEPFFTTKPPGAGSGLGLAMCHGIVTQAGGKIALESELDQGTSFYIYLPCSADSTPSAPAPAPPRPGQPRAGHETLLVVEDEPMILRVACMALEKLGYRVHAAADGLAALEVAANVSGRIDLLVTDVVMPRLGGRELARRLAEIRPETKVLYTSGYAENAIAFGGVLSEGINFMQKPYSLSALAERVRVVLDQPVLPGVTAVS